MNSQPRQMPLWGKVVVGTLFGSLLVAEAVRVYPTMTSGPPLPQYGYVAKPTDGPPPAAPEANKVPDGYMRLAEGIYGRWCTDTCSTSGVIGDSTYTLLEVWAKDRDAGDVYAQVNLLDDNGTVIGWTNDTLFLAKGQRGILTFSSYGTGFARVELTKFHARGAW